MTSTVDRSFGSDSRRRTGAGLLGILSLILLGQLLDGHPRAIRLYDAFPTLSAAGGTLYCLVLEYAHHGDLSAFLRHGGERLKRDTDGYYMAPAIFTDTTPEMRINREEIFGPIAAVIKVKNYDEALAVANDTPYGLSAGIVTTSLKLASHFKRNAASGLVMVNLPTAGLDYHVPFGGRKRSSYGPREQGTYAKEFYTIVKTTYIAP